MEEILPLIIGIIWLVYTIYSKGKRKEARKNHSGRSEKTKAPSILEQIFADSDALKPQPYEMTTEYDEDLFVEEHEVEEVVEKQEELPRPFLRTELENFVHEGQPAITPSGEYIMEERIGDENQIENQEFDLQKAIIFSEILNAPYIGYK